MFAHPTAAALNHLLMQNGWALKRLARFSGKTVRFDIAPLSFAYTILPDGTLLSAEPDSSADAHCVIAPSLLPRLALHDEQANAEIRSTGDAALLTEIFFLSRNLRWDVAEDLSHFTGDIASERIVQAAHAKRQQLSSSATNLAQAAAEYLTEENPQIAKPQQLH
ncbi:MAG: hypothetical protein PHF75_03460, partial [Gallionella sp.]|nr:hypothetical protein [Gallionella sp.]